MTNRYPTKCGKCGKSVPAGKGIVARVGRRWVGRCNGCAGSGRGVERARGVVVTRFSSGDEVYRNYHGRCEDAPCCGCCS